MSGTGLHLGRLSPAAAIRPPSDSSWAQGALLDANFQEGRYRFNGVSYATETDFLIAAGGTPYGKTVAFKPYSSPNSPELITNGDFQQLELAGWNQIVNGTSTATALPGAARLFSDGTTGVGGGGAGITQPIMTTEGAAYSVTYTVSGGTTNFRIGGTTGETAPGAAGGTRGPGIHTDTFSARGPISHFYAFRASAGTTMVSDVSVKPCLPLEGLSGSGMTIEIAAKTPPSPTAREVLWSCGHLMTADPGDETLVAYQLDGSLVVEVRAASHVQAALNLGTVAPETRFFIRAGFAANAFFAQLDDGKAVHDDLGVLPGLAVMRLGHSFHGQVWNGEIERLTLYRESGVEAFYSLIPNLIRCEGDSFMTHGHGGGPAGSIISRLESITDRTVMTTASGNSTMPEISERLSSTEFRHLRPKTTVIWDGSENPVDTLSQVAPYCESLATGLRQIGHQRFVIIPACANLLETDMTISDAIRDELKARWPHNVLDWRDRLDLDPNGAPAREMFRDPDLDATHLSGTAMEIMAAAIANFITAKGW